MGEEQDMISRYHLFIFCCSCVPPYSLHYLRPIESILSLFNPSCVSQTKESILPPHLLKAQVKE
jgi:hypothetical protein